ncbi:MAG: serine/threonine-protein kinase [Planctomycetes bacterium]|nr:serine/threonine-protein kinase [Planctomycetota bacterium]
MSEKLTPAARARLLRAAAQPSAAGELLYGRYRITRELGRGGMGVVYEAEDVALRRRVALKVLRLPAQLGPGLAEQVLREARAAARLDHPNIAAVYDAHDDAIALQFIEGRPLSEIEKPELRRLVGWLRDAALAVHHAHEQGIVHRDLKPHNLMIDGERVVVTDFGLAKELALDTSQSLSGAVLGTPSYMPPEQAGGRAREVDARSDVYALGATLYDRLAGRPPFVDKDLVALLRAVVEDEPPPLASLAPDVPRDLALVVHKCLAKEKERRYASAKELAEDLTRWLAGEPVRAEAPTLAYRLEKFVRRNRAWVAAALVLALFALGAGAVLWSERAQNDAIAAVLSTLDPANQHLANARVLVRRSQAEADAELELGIDLCQRFLARRPAAEIEAKLGQLLREHRLFDEALAAFDRTLALAPGYGPARLERGLLLAKLQQERVTAGDAPAAEALRARALDDLAVVDDGGVLLETFARVLGGAERARLSGQPDEARRLYAEAASLDPTRVEPALALAPLSLERGDLDSALTQAMSAMDLFRGFAPAYVAQAAARVSGDASAEAPTQELEGFEGRFGDYPALLVLRPSTALAYANRGQGELRQAARRAAEGDLAEASSAVERAKEDLERALTIEPELAAARSDRALVELALSRLGDASADFARARAELEHALALAPESAAYLANLALLTRRAAERDPRASPARVESVLARLDAALARAGGDATLWLERAQLLALRAAAPGAIRAEADRAAARAAFESAIALEPWSARPRGLRGLARQAWGELDGAREDIEAALFLGADAELRPRLAAALTAR